jgi:hypothetical protein
MKRSCFQVMIALTIHDSYEMVISNLNHLLTGKNENN